MIFRELFIGGRLMKQVILKRFEVPDQIISFEKGRFEKITLGGVTIGRATYEPGWKWSTHIGSKTGATLPGRACRAGCQRSSYSGDARCISYRNASRRSVLHPAGARYVGSQA